MRRLICIVLLLFLSACRTTHPKTATAPHSIYGPPSRFRDEAARLNSTRAISTSARTHRVRKGETLYAIARKYGVSVSDLMAANHIKNPRSLRVGQVLRVPKIGVTPVRRSTPPGGFHVESKFRWPVRGKVIRRFGSFHNGERSTGIDIKAPAGAPVVAAKSGVVDFVSENFPGWGKVVVLNHRDGYRTWYAHNSVILVKKNQWVKQGQTIARVGSTGRTKTAALNFRILKNDKPVDPLPLLSRR